MIRRISGELTDVGEESVLVRVAGITYEVFVPPSVMQTLEDRPIGSQVELATYYYLTAEPSKSVPVLLGFEDDVQRQFFELLTSVPRFGPRAAIRALDVPVPTLAKAIELQDHKLLKSLPGVGKQKARDLVATLSGKVGRFVDLEEGEAVAASGEEGLVDEQREAVEILTQLGTNKSEAIQSVRRVSEKEPAPESSDEIVRRVFRGR